MRTLLIIWLAFTLGTASALAQDARPIREGEAIAGTLESDSRHRYTLELDEGSFMYGQVDQLTVDVVVKILDPEGQEVGRFDSPARGPEPFRVETETSGTFVIEITSFEEAEGDYEIEVLRVEPVATDPDGRVEQLIIPYAGDDVPGGVVGVVEDGELSYTKAFGMSNLSYDIPFEVDTRSNIGSVTKQLTAVGILLLQAEGKLSLDDDVRKHVPEVPDFGPTTTIRNLLTHTSGYREIYNLLPMSGRQGEDGIRRDEAIRILQRQPDLQNPPNTAFNYNNTGFILLATIIERISDQTFPEYMKERVFEPLGMRDTRVKAVQGEIIPGSSQGYVRSGDGYRAVRDLAASYGAGGIYTTVEDLAKWMMNYRDATLGGRGAVDAITANTVIESGDSTGYGLGLGLTKHGGRTLFTHTGGDVAHRAYFGYYPELESGVILMSNNASFDLSMGRDIASAFFGEHFEEEEADEEEIEAAEMPEERMEAIAGEWILEAPQGSLPITYTVEDGEMYAQARGQSRNRVIPTSDSTMAFDGPDATVTFHFEEDGSVERATHHQGGDIPMRRPEEKELTAEDLEEYAGRYYSEEIQTWYELTVEDGEITAHHLRLDPFALEHTEGDVFSAGALNSIEFQRAGNGTITGFTADNGRTRGVFFRKM